METKLRQLFALQQIDSSLDELEELKGDLPGRIRELEAQETALKDQLSSLETTMRTAFTQRDNADGEIVALREKAEKYKTQQFQVRNNREYDALTREMDAAQDTIVRLEKEMEMLEGKATLAVYASSHHGRLAMTPIMASATSSARTSFPRPSAVSIHTSRAAIPAAGPALRASNMTTA